MIKEKIEVLLTTAALVLLTALIHGLYLFGHISRDPLFSEIMTIATAIYTFGGCILQTIGFRKISIGLGFTVFFVLCICLFYSVSTLELIVFFVCMAIVIRKSTKACNCDCGKTQ